MYPRRFDYVRAENLDDAVRLLAENPDARPIAGGQSLVPLLKLRLISPTLLIDIGSLPLRRIEEKEDAIEIGALVTHVQMTESAPLKKYFQIISDAGRHIADPQVRNMGTVGGALCEADPAGDWVPVMVALDAEVTAKGPSGERRIPIRELVVGPYETSLQEGELLTGVSLSKAAAKNSNGCYLKVERRAGDFALASAAVRIMTEGARCTGARVVLGAVGIEAVEMKKAEEMLSGETLTGKLLDQVAREVSVSSEPIGDQRASAEYRRALIEKLVRRGLEIAVTRALGEEVEASVLSS